MSGEFRVYRPDGTTRETEFSATANFIRGSHLSILRDISDRKQTEARLQQQLDREQLVTQITDSIRQTLDLDQILQVAVDQVRRFLQTDRVIIFRFRSDWQGTVVAESVGPGWTAILSTTLRDPCFGEEVGIALQQAVSQSKLLLVSTAGQCSQVHQSGWPSHPVNT
ncbi:GAF domain-containing protein [Romeria aff. gracilis LEGE 07310]|uniref:GAF domain-containing protein n=1 Tax=Vasconcelosia minhoensis LEGE 07310 TaxID=915328 RepID=A0A8J7AY86_9CYAN|nr:GAF domain-containing protein [Romeria gracilis]MBE9079908.1 GAF domain-containing protein [Romeria aff. gracilis LEGE 07310]